MRSRAGPPPDVTWRGVPDGEGSGGKRDKQRLENQDDTDGGAIPARERSKVNCPRVLAEGDAGKLSTSLLTDHD